MTRMELHSLRDARKKRRVIRDFIAERAALMAWRNQPEWAAKDGYLPTLGVASHFRATALQRKRAGRPLLG